MILQRGSSAPEVHHLRPLMMYSSSSRRMRVLILVASDEATSGSVIAQRPSVSGQREKARANAGAALACRSAPGPGIKESNLFPDLAHLANELRARRFG